MRAKSKTRRGILATTICAAFLLTGCGDKLGPDPAFKDIQRAPPRVTAETAEYLLKNDRRISEWIVETARKCNQFGCVGTL